MTPKRIKILFLSSHMPQEKESFYRYSDSPNQQKLCWQNIDFDLSPQKNKQYDAILVLNHPVKSEYINYRKGQKFALMQEPGESIFPHPFMFLHDKETKTIFSPIKNHPQVELSPPHLGWYFLNKSYNELLNLPIPTKSKKISCVASNILFIKGHYKRHIFVNHLRKLNLGIDFFGKGLEFIEDKWDALYPYEYSIAIENSSKNYYFTEKIQDCFLSYTVPLYFGCTNISKYFPPKSFIALDINDYDEAVKTIRDTMSNDDFDSRIDDLQEARDLVLNKYHISAFAKNKIVPRIDFSALPKTHLVQQVDYRLTKKIIYIILNVRYWHKNFLTVTRILLSKIQSLILSK